MQWHRISVLINEIRADLDQQRYLSLTSYCKIAPNGQPVHLQQSTVRTNCIDCLDRTNVVQSILAKLFLETQLKEQGVLESHQSLEQLHDFYTTFRNIWADHADAISLQYSGTGALKTDYTRTGVRTKRGILTDFGNSILRYIKNHYLDGARQDAFDLFMGLYQVNADAPTPFDDEITRGVIMVISSAILTAFLLLYYILFPSSLYS